MYLDSFACHQVAKIVKKFMPRKLSSRKPSNLHLSSKRSSVHAVSKPSSATMPAAATPATAATPAAAATPDIPAEQRPQSDYRVDTPMSLYADSEDGTEGNTDMSYIVVVQWSLSQRTFSRQDAPVERTQILSSKY